ncbi:hypothetical protein G7B40_040580 [Aetokthonos hydrillicola Thurmond2011]|jgi:hypothetical protein|uniref:Uncharacterized protein n=1 Tax=Aetokthonos hydrillicola Thurmond2011 TaxID=2712845 RepID=A0AAP5MA42_9CYAN|nr:hypothetical protein [Aetokthonos hydrillicola]MBO3461014.1 hypothetical protein [Aetokthonos hydrillicola CCALA 1050]MBW4588417.1 hypothetical protein [Aetokthonos hydrillicola CCALA 1050]MDR9900786.1 hypothetical protein [Aetokthonos hydrillicola Thurmond2011]
MKIYVQSSGREHGYYWLAKGETRFEAGKIHNFPIFQKTRFLINPQDFSIVLYRLEGKLLLLLTGLRTERQDRMHRYISNSIAWIGSNDDEIIMREISALVLNNNLQIQKILNYAIVNSKDPREFEVHWTAIEGLIQVSRTTYQSLPHQELQGKIARISDARKQELAETLMKYNLPLRDGALVVVTTASNKDILEKSRVWRALSSDNTLEEYWQATSKNIFQEIASIISKWLRNLKRIFISN